MPLLELFLAIWILCGVIAYGGTFAFFQRRWVHLADKEYYNDLRFSLGIGLLGIVGFVLSAYKTNWFQHGFKFK